MILIATVTCTAVASHEISEIHSVVRFATPGNIRVGFSMKLFLVMWKASISSTIIPPRHRAHHSTQFTKQFIYTKEALMIQFGFQVLLLNP